MGLAGSIPLLLQERGASYTNQSLFSLVSWPFSLVNTATQTLWPFSLVNTATQTLNLKFQHETRASR
jgi:hypothetical protein